MPAAARPRRQPTDDWRQLRLLVASPEQAAYELLRPLVIFGQSVRARARETSVPERTLRRKAARFAAAGIRSLFDVEEPPASDRLFRLRATRVLFAGGYVRFRHWRLYGERGLAGERAAMWVDAVPVRPCPLDQRLHQQSVRAADVEKRAIAIDRGGDHAPAALPTRLIPVKTRLAARVGRGEIRVLQEDADVFVPVGIVHLPPPAYSRPTRPSRSCAAVPTVTSASERNPGPTP
ncbi:MAG TPA: hypothetical protein VH482_09835 [Thermomicrobiales bacterium]|jgi:hypothetical protein